MFDTFERLNELLEEKAKDFEERMQRVMSILKLHISREDNECESHSMKHRQLLLFVKR